MTVVTPVIVDTTASVDTGTALACEYPAHSRGDLVIQWCAVNDGSPAWTPPATIGSPSDPAITVLVPHAGTSLGNEIAGTAWAWIADADEVAGSIAVTIPAVREAITGCIVFQSGTFHPDLVDSVTSMNVSSGSTANRPAWSAAGPDHMLVVGVGIDDNDLTAGTPTGWTNQTLSNGADIGMALYTRNTLTTSDPEAIASTNFGSFGSTRYITFGLAVIPQTIPDVPTTLELPVSIPTPTFTSPVDIHPDVIETGISFPTPAAVAGNDLLISPATVTLTSELDAALVGGDLTVAVSTILMRVEMRRPSEYRRTGNGGASFGGYEPKATPAERRGQFDLRRKVQDLET